MSEIFSIPIPKFAIRDYRDWTTLSMDDKYIVLMLANEFEADEFQWDSETWHKMWEFTVRYRIYQGMPSYSCATVPPPPPSPVYDTDVYGVITAENDALTAMKRLDF